MNKQHKDILLNTAAIFFIVAILKFFIADTMMIWFFLFPLQGLITKFIFASPTKTEQGIFIDLKSGIKIKHCASHFLLPIVMFFLMVFSVITGFIIADKFKGFLSEILQILCLLLPFIATRTYLFINKLPLSFLYIFFYHQYRGNTIVAPELPIYKPMEEDLNIKITRNLNEETVKRLNDWDMFQSPRSRVRNWINE